MEKISKLKEGIFFMLFKIIYHGLDKFVVSAKNEIEARSIAFVKLSIDDFDEFYNMTVVELNLDINSNEKSQEVKLSNIIDINTFDELKRKNIRKQILKHTKSF